MKEKKKEKRWLRFRHKVITALLRPTLGVYTRMKYHIKIQKYKDPQKRPYLIMMNHQTAYDQFFVSIAFRQPVYYVASEDIFSMGWLSSLIRWLVAPIPIKKQTTDLNAVKTCIRVAREGGTIGIAPEGNRTFHGRTVYIKPGIASLAKKLGMPIAIFRIEDGYGVHPRWSDVVRGGKMRAYVKRVIEPEEYADMNTRDLANLLEAELWVDEAKVTGRFPHKKNAEFLERAMYVCPWCGLTTYESHRDIITCKKCNRQVRHLDTKELEGVGFQFPYRFVGDWYDAQYDYVNRLDLTQTETPLYEETVKLSRVKACERKVLLEKKTTLRLYPDRISIGDKVCPFDALGAITILGKNKLNVYEGNRILQLEGDKRFNALKYVNLYHHYLNMTGGENGDFLGL